MTEKQTAKGYFKKFENELLEEFNKEIRPSETLAPKYKDPENSFYMAINMEGRSVKNLIMKLANLSAKKSYKEIKLAREDERKKVKREQILEYPIHMISLKDKEQLDIIKKEYEKQVDDWRKAVVDERKHIAEKIFKELDEIFVDDNDGEFDIYEGVYEEIKKRFLSMVVKEE